MIIVFLFLLVLNLNSSNDRTTPPKLLQIPISNIFGESFHLDSLPQQTNILIPVNEIYCAFCVQVLLDRLTNSPFISQMNILLLFNSQPSVKARKFFMRRVKKYVHSKIYYVFSDKTKSDNIFNSFNIDKAPAILIFSEDYSFKNFIPFDDLFTTNGLLKAHVIDSILTTYVAK